jgi:hypothetical protein
VRFLVGLLAAVAGCGVELDDDGGPRSQPADASTPQIDAAVSPPIDARPCMGGNAAMQEPGGQCFVLFAGPKTRAIAELDCVALGGHLATVKTAASNAIVSALVSTTPSAFLGGTDAATEGAYVWPDGTAATYTNWRTGEPNNGNMGGYEEDCIVIQGLLAGVWDDRPCAPPPVGTGSYAYVCSY